MSATIDFTIKVARISSPWRFWRRPTVWIDAGRGDVALAPGDSVTVFLVQDGQQAAVR